MGRFNNLPKEIMLEILTRLPTETVLDCKLVCRPWRELVRLPCFSQLHLNRLDSGTSSFIFHIRQCKEFTYAEYDDNFHETLISRKTRMNLRPLFHKHVYFFIGSCNGLICLGAHYKDEINQHHYGPSYICNPVTREYIKLPISKGRYSGTGFGYVLSTNEYKVVRMCPSEKDSKVGIFQVYTLGSGNGWINVGNTDINVTRCAGVFANETLYWANLRKGTILAFHLTDEKFSEFPLPHCLRQAGVPDFSIKLRVLGGFLSAIYPLNAGSRDIWLLKKMSEDNSNDLRWSKEFSFGCNSKSRPLGYTKSGTLLYYGHNKMYSYDPKDSSTKMDPKGGKSFPEIIPHKNTLVSLEVLGEKDIKTMESSESASSSEQKTVIKRKFKQAENSDKLKKLRNEVRDL